MFGMKLVLSCLVLFTATSLSAQPRVYRCETNGKIAYSDAPCVGAKVIDATPTQGADKMSGASRKGREVQRDEFTALLDGAMRPLHGRSHDEMNVLRRRVNLASRDQQQCAELDSLVPKLEADAAKGTGEGKGLADVNLYKTRKRFFDLKC